MQSFDPTSFDSFLSLARSWAATVTVVTARRDPELRGAGPEIDGFTATAFLTVSLDPPIIAVSANSGSSSFAMLRDCSSFAVNLLSEDQSEIANAFARPAGERANLWKQLQFTLDAQGVPLLLGTTGGFSARVRQRVEAGDHTLVLGDVTAIHLGDHSGTLVYHNRGYGRVVRHG